MKRKHAFILAAGALVVGIAADADTARAEKMEKCYGIVKSGKNDCAAKDGSHSCAGQARRDGDPSEFILLPEGICDRLVDASTE